MSGSVRAGAWLAVARRASWRTGAADASGRRSAMPAGFGRLGHFVGEPGRHAAGHEGQHEQQIAQDAEDRHG